MLQYLTVPVTAFEQNCSIVWCDDTMEAAVIDPGGDLPRITAAAVQLGVQLKAIWLTHAHIDHAGGTAELARQLGLDEAQTRSAGLAGLLHDLGKAAMPMAVLNKPGKLTDAEFTIMKSHPAEGHRMLQALESVDPIALDVCLNHHEKTDGSGYPKGLKNGEISLFAKMGAVCDVYDAITSNRPYKTGWDPAESLRKMAEWAEGHFDHQVFQAFVKSLGIYPIGSLVRLASGRLGVVVDQSTGSLTMPLVKVFYSTKSELRIPAEVIDLSAPNSHDKIVGREDPAKWKFPDLNELWSGLSNQTR